MVEAVDLGPPVSSALWSQLSTRLPDHEETALLRACLLDGDPALEAWTRWRQAVTRDAVALRHAVSAFNVLLPLLLWNVRRNGGDVPPLLRTYLRSAWMTEEMRWQRYRSICGEALGALREAGIPVIALKGSTLCESVYPLPVLRHSADIDVLLREPDLAPATELLARLGWRQRAPVDRAAPHQLPSFIHPSGLPLELHHHLVLPYYRLPYDRMWARSERAVVAGVEVRALSAADTLLHVCAHAMVGDERILRWVPDAWFVLDRHRDLDWTTLVSTAAGARLGLSAYVTLRYLATAIGAPVPREALAELRTAAARTGFLGRSAARIAARPWPTGTAREIWARPGSRRQRLLLLWRRVFPSPVEFALRYDLRWWELPLPYLGRFVRYARRSRV